MKKAIAILMAVSLLLAAASCVKSEEKTTSSPDVSVSDTVNAKSCEEIFNTVKGVINFPSMVSVKEKSLSNRYGIESNMYKDYIFMTAEEATLADTFILILANDSESKDTIIEKLNNFITQSQETNVNYNPDQYEIIKNASVKTEGNYVYLVFSSDMDTIEEMIRENI